MIRFKKCPICNMKFKFDMKIGPFKKINNKQLVIEKCPSCGLRKNQTLFSLKQEEIKNLERSNNNPSSLNPKKFKIYAKEKMKQIYKYKKGGKLIDLGCGYGWIVKMARDRGLCHGSRS